MDVREYAMSLPEVSEEPHFEKTSFRVNKKIFLTMNAAEDKGVVKLSLVDQDVFSTMSKGAIAPVNNKWGNQGWTEIDLKTVQYDLLIDTIKSAYTTVAPKRLVKLLDDDSDT